MCMQEQEGEAQEEEKEAAEAAAVGGNGRGRQDSEMRRQQLLALEQDQGGKSNGNDGHGVGAALLEPALVPSPAHAVRVDPRCLEAIHALEAQVGERMQKMSDKYGLKQPLVPVPATAGSGTTPHEDGDGDRERDGSGDGLIAKLYKRGQGQSVPPAGWHAVTSSSHTGLPLPWEAACAMVAQFVSRARSEGSQCRMNFRHLLLHIKSTYAVDLLDETGGSGSDSNSQLLGGCRDALMQEVKRQLQGGVQPQPQQLQQQPTAETETATEGKGSKYQYPDFDDDDDDDGSDSEEDEEEVYLAKKAEIEEEEAEAAVIACQNTKFLNMDSSYLQQCLVAQQRQARLMQRKAKEQRKERNRAEKEKAKVKGVKKTKAKTVLAKEAA
jgi:hypothetical protein